MFQADLVRLFVGLSAGWSLIMTVAILLAFTRRVGWGMGWRDIEDRKRTHIFSVSAAFVVLSGYAVVEVHQRVGTELTWRGPVLLVAFLLSGLGQWSMLSAQIQTRREAVTPTVPVDPVLRLIDRVMTTLGRIEGRQVTGADSMARMEDAASHVAHDLQSSQARADQVTEGAPGAAADAGAQSGRTE
ncbi:MAG: hypothetical protein H0W25_13770 [Acidimicrobiia bacterium]|nr:hypothetical protein [Acidimicrobiia bacterium]